MTIAPREDIAELLRTGHSYRQIREHLRVSSATIAATRKHYRIPLTPPEPPPAGTPQEQAAITRRYPRVADMARAGATLQQIHAETRVSPPTIVKVRRILGIAVPHRPALARTIPDTINTYSQPYGDGHARWTGPHTAGTHNNTPQPQLWANGTVYAARREIFRHHHGRPPEGTVRAGCTEPTCVAGPHLTDRRIRQANQRADAAYLEYFGPDAP